MLKQHTYFSILFLASLFIIGCGAPEAKQLPVFGNKDVIDGKTVYHKISDFKFIDQDSNIVTNASFKDKVYIADVFFTHCPTICPKVKKEMLRIYDKYKNDDRVAFISHSIDTKRDTVGRLKYFADKLEIDSKKWHLVTGDKDELFRLADEYFIVAKEDDTAEGGYDHSPMLILVDQNRLVRGNADGTSPEAVDKFMKTIDQLLADNSVAEQNEH